MRERPNLQRGRWSMGRLSGKVAIVTGAASGLGRAVAELYAREGAAVVVADVRADEGATVASRIVAGGGRAWFTLLDVRDPDAVRNVVLNAENEYGRLDIMTANAGILDGVGPFEELSETVLDALMEVNFKGVMRCFQHAIPALRRSEGGSMTVTASLAAHRGMPTLAAYSASKGAVCALVRALAAELHPQIRVNAVSPGSIRTDMSRSATPQVMPNGMVRPVADPAEVAAAHLFLASEEASFITGQMLVVDGGRSVFA